MTLFVSIMFQHTVLSTYIIWKNIKYYYNLKPSFILDVNNLRGSFGRYCQNPQNKILFLAVYIFFYSVS